MLAAATVVGRGNNIHVEHGDDTGLYVRFYFNKIHGKDFIKINVPGDSKTEWDQPVKDVDKVRFAKQWDAYQKQQNQFGSETPLDISGLFTETQVNMYRAFNVFTIEGLCGVADSFISKMGPGVREDQKKARAYLADITEKKKAEEFERALKIRDDQLELQKQQIESLQKQIASLVGQVPIVTTGETVKRRGRKPGSKNKPKPEIQPITE